MRKLLLIILLVLIAALSVLPVAASPMENMTSLAQYYPTTTSVFFAFRTDSDHILAVDNLLRKIGPSIGAFDGMTLSDLLDQAAREIDPQGDFESVFGWIGDAAAVGITSPDFALPQYEGETERFVRFALSIRDPRAAEAFFDQSLTAGNIKEQVEGGIIYRAEQGGADSPVFFLNNAVLLFVMNYGDPGRVLPNFDQSLADLPEFAPTIGHLPLPDYNLLAYFDPAFMIPLLDNAQANMEAQPLLESMNFAEVVRAVGPQAMGATLLEDRSLVLDMTSIVRDPAVLDQFAGGAGTAPGEAIDLSFTTSIPASAMLVLQDTGFGPGLLNALAQLEAFATVAEEQAQQGNLPEDQQGLAQLDQLLTIGRNSFRGLSGLSLEEGFGWMTGDFVMFADFALGTSEALPIIPNMGLVAANSDAAASAALFEALPKLFTELGVDTTDENGTLVISTLNEMTQNPALDLLFRLDERAFAAGTRPAVTDFFSGGGLADTTAFQTASAVFLPETQFLAYAHVTPLAALVTQVAEMSGDTETGHMGAILALFESASLTVAYDEASGGVVRGVLTLAQ